MAQPIRSKPHPIRLRPLLVGAVVTTTVGGIAITVDAARHDLTYPSPLGSLAVGVTLLPWVVFAVVWGVAHLDRRVRQSAFAEGYVCGVARRIPPSDRLGWTDE